MGGGPVMEDVYVPYHWPYFGFHGLPLYASSLASLRYKDFDVESALVGLVSALQGWPSYMTMNGNHPEEGTEAVAERIRNVAVEEETSKSHHEPAVTTVLEPAISENSVALPNESSDMLEKMIPSSIEAAHFSPEAEIASPSFDRDLEVQNMRSGSESNDGLYDTENKESLQTEEVEKSVQLEGVANGVQLEETEKSISSEGMEKEDGTNEERTAATVVQAMYRGHLVRMSSPLEQLRAIARIEGKLRKLKEQAGDGAFLEELRKKESTAKLAFEEGTLALLLQLDNIQGSHPLVRHIRKGVAREVISLQESVDALLSHTISTSR